MRFSGETRRMPDIRMGRSFRHVRQLLFIGDARQLSNQLIEIIVPKVMASRYRSVTDLNGHLTQLSSNRFCSRGY